MPRSQPLLPFGPIRNSSLFSNHWLENRLPLEPEWEELRDEARSALDRMAELWREQKPRVERYGNEAGLEQGFIQPVLHILGWKLKYQPHLRGRDPDYALFLTNEALDSALAVSRTSPDFWNRATLVADAKAWHIRLDRPTIVNEKREYPPEQIEWYMHHSGCAFGILTNGRLWRLFPRELSSDQSRFETYLECELPKILDIWIGEPGQITFDQQQQALADFLRFYLFFSPAGYSTRESRDELIFRAMRGSSEYRLGVGEGLRERVFEALRLAVEGFIAYAPNKLHADRDLALCREHGFTLLYRLLFIMYAEDRLLLPFPANDLYARNRSLHRHRTEIAAILDRIADGRAADSLSHNATGYYDDLKSLFDLINTGNRRYHVPPYNGGLFNPEQHPFLEEKTLPDAYVARIIDQLSRAHDPEKPDLGLFRVDYRDLAIQHLGTIYEGLLELEPHWLNGKAELLTRKGERRASGSYYTPNHIVDYIVEKTLGPLCKEIDAELRAEIEDVTTQIKRSRGGNRTALEKKLDRLIREYDDRILRLRILDPAMGSGHFLLRACAFLAEDIATNPHTHDERAELADTDESTLTFWKRRVVERCIFGVDLNRMAVELAQLALWLETIAVDQPLTFLSHHLRHGNSLIGATVDRLGALPGAMEIQENTFLRQVEGRLPIMLQPLETIRELPSETPEQIKEKDRQLRQILDRARRPFLQIADLWISTYFSDPDSQVSTTDYQRAIEAIDQPRRFEKLAGEPWFERALSIARSAEVIAFHWELEFPEVFFDKTGRRADGGFDAVIGNPPWGEASALGVIQQLAEYEPVNEDHAECFIVRAVLLGARGVRIGMVLPDTILSPAKANIRRFMLTVAQTIALYNIGPDWFGPEVRMATVLWASTLSETPIRQFVTGLLPIATRRMAQSGQMALDDAVEKHSRPVQASECLADEEVAIPLFGTADAVIVITSALAGPKVESICERGRGVELNKAGVVISCPQCGRWDAPPLQDRSGEYRQKTCSHCGTVYRPSPSRTRTLVADLPGNRGNWVPYIDGDAIRRYEVPARRWLDVSADGIGYKPVTLYRSPKLLIRQAGIGLSAILDTEDSYCPQSVYVYRINRDVKDSLLDEELLLSLLCSRLFQLQVFCAFGEIDSSRAFAKLTHTRLARLRLVALERLQCNQDEVKRIKVAVRKLAKGGLDGQEHLDWEIERCWARICELNLAALQALIANFALVHESEVLLGLFPGGVLGREEYWLQQWNPGMR